MKKMYHVLEPFLAFSFLLFFNATLFRQVTNTNFFYTILEQSSKKIITMTTSSKKFHFMLIRQINTWVIEKNHQPYRGFYEK